MPFPTVEIRPLFASDDSHPDPIDRYLVAAGVRVTPASIGAAALGHADTPAPSVRSSFSHGYLEFGFSKYCSRKRASYGKRARGAVPAWPLEEQIASRAVSTP